MDKIFRKVSVSDRLPETSSQHGDDFLSYEVAVITNEGISSDFYRRRYDLHGGSGKLISEGWCTSINVTHWLEEVKLPNEAETELAVDEHLKSLGLTENRMFVRHDWMTGMSWMLEWILKK